MHLVHFNEKYGSLREAADKPDGLAVLAVFFQVITSTIDIFLKLTKISSTFNVLLKGVQSRQSTI